MKYDHGDELPSNELITILSWNLAAYGRPGGQGQRDALIEETIRLVQPTIALVQEVYAPDPDQAALRVQELAKRSGLACTLPNGRVAVVFGGHDLHCAVLWNPASRISGIPRSFQYRGGPDFWHAFIVGTIDIEGVGHLSIGSYHAPSLSGAQRVDEAKRIVSAAVSGYLDDRLVVCGDFNSLSNARTPDGEYYDPDPYDGRAAHPQHVFQCTLTDTPAGPTRVRVDRRPAEILSYGGLLHDAAPTIGEPWNSTVGHDEPGGPHGLRRTDHAWVTTPVLPAVVSCQRHDSATAREVSDHEPIILSLDARALREAA